jgi:hypothetical protein
LRRAEPAVRLPFVGRSGEKIHGLTEENQRFPGVVFIHGFVALLAYFVQRFLDIFG